MDWFFTEYPPLLFAAALAVTAFAGFVKGAIGFAMPLIMMSAFSAFLTPHQALAGLILPTLITNISQAGRQGLPAAIDTAKRYRRFLTGTLVFLVISAQFVDFIPKVVFLLMLGVPITLFAGAQLLGRSLALPLHHRNRAEWVLGIIGGIYGGVSGIWGPPLLVYLLSIQTDKAETIRVQGVVFLLGAVALTGAHLTSGLLSGANLAFSAAMVLPALAGQAVGQRLHDRLDGAVFRKWTQGLLVVTGLNLVWQAVSS